MWPKAGSCDWTTLVHPRLLPGADSCGLPGGTPGGVAGECFPPTTNTGYPTMAARLTPADAPPGPHSESCLQTRVPHPLARLCCVVLLGTGIESPQHGLGEVLFTVSQELDPELHGV